MNSLRPMQGGTVDGRYSGLMSARRTALVAAQNGDENAKMAKRGIGSNLTLQFVGLIYSREQGY